MLYLEDYLEMIEQLPEELRDRFTEIRELDLQVQNTVDSLEDRVKKFFVACKSSNLDQKAKDEQFDRIKQDYYKALEDADDKVQITTQVYDLVDRHLRKLDQELSKFKMELEADSAGITELLERRSLELDKPLQAINNNRAEKRKYVMGNHLEPKRTALSERSLSAIANEAAAGYRTNTNLVGLQSRSGSPAPQSYTLGQIGSGSNAIAVAASQAIAATQQTLSQQVGKKPLSKLQAGRRTASLKASYEAMKGSDLTKTLSVGKETFAAGGSGIGEPTKRSKKSKASGAGSSVSSLLQAQQEAVASLEEELPLGLDGAAAEQNDWQYDPNEPRYCVCNQVSYGDMVACDNESCPFEWFHYDCVGITQPPKGKWYCPSCSAAMKRRGQTKERKMGDKEKGER